MALQEVTVRAKPSRTLSRDCRREEIGYPQVLEGGLTEQATYPFHLSNGKPSICPQIQRMAHLSIYFSSVHINGKLKLTAYAE